MNKKGAEITVGTIIIIILALVVLVVLIYGFTTGWGSLWQNVIGFGGGKINVQTVIQSCQIACTTQSYYEYCNRKRNVIFEEKEKGTSMSCDELEKSPKNVGLSCDRLDCSEVEQSCADLDKRYCFVNSKRAEGCEVEWMSPEVFGAEEGKKTDNYKVQDFTAWVTKSSDKSAHKNEICAYVFNKGDNSQ